MYEPPLLAAVTLVAPPARTWRRAGGAGYEGRPAGEVGWRSGCLARRRAAVPGRDQGDLAAEPGQGLLVVSDQVLAVALVALVVVVLAGVGVVLAAGHDRPGDAGQGPGDRGRGFLLMALAELAGQAAEPGAGPGAGAGGGPGRLGHGRAQVPVALAGGGVLALAGGLVPRRAPQPTQSLPGRADGGAGAPVAGAFSDHLAGPGEARDLP